MFLGNEDYTSNLEFSLTSPQKFLIIANLEVWQELLALCMIN